ncbi:MAG: nucleotide exchange factor GrpE [Planctomycetota bacterium]
MDNTNDQLSDAKPEQGQGDTPPAAASASTSSRRQKVTTGKVDEPAAGDVPDAKPADGADEAATNGTAKADTAKADADRADTGADDGASPSDTSESDAPADGAGDDASATQTATLPTGHGRSADDLREAARKAADDTDAEMPALPAVGVSVELDDRLLEGASGWSGVEQAVKRLPADARQVVVLECNALDKIDSVGLGRLLLLADLVRADGGRIVLTGASDDIASLIRTLQLEAELPVVSSLAELADSGLSPASPAMPMPSSGTTTIAGIAGTAGAPGTEGASVDLNALGALEQRIRTDLRNSARALEGIWKQVHTTGNASNEQLTGLRELRGYITDAGRNLGNVQHYINEIAQRMSAFEQHLNKLTHYFNDRFREDKTKEQAFETLYEDLKKYRDNFLYQAQKPVFKSLVILHDDAQKMVDSIEDPQAREKVDLLREMLLELLYRNDVEIMDARPEKFNREFQKVIRRESTKDPEQDYQIKEILREGFMWADRILRPQEVVVLRYDGSAGKPATSSSININKDASADETGDWSATQSERMLADMVTAPDDGTLEKGKPDVPDAAPAESSAGTSTPAADSPESPGAPGDEPKAEKSGDAASDTADQPEAKPGAGTDDETSKPDPG